MSIIRKVFSKINALFSQRSHWFNEVMFTDCRKFWNHREFGLDLVNLGSSSAKNGFNYASLNIKAANWAMAPQTFVGDYAILTNYCSYLKPGATVIIPLCPFSSLGGGNNDLADKYYTVVRSISIPHASLRRRNIIMGIKIRPLMHIPLYAVLGDIKALFCKSNPQTSSDYEADANHWITSWKKEFSLYDLHNPFALINQDRFADSVAALQELLEFCQSHEYNVVMVIPPMTKHLAEKLDTAFRKQYIYDFIEQSNTIGAPVLDYIDHPAFAAEEYFRNAYLMNDKGAIEFTKQVINDVVQK